MSKNLRVLILFSRFVYFIICKEFCFVRIDPYWKIRYFCSTLGLNIFGDKATLLKRINNHWFLNEMPKKTYIDPDNFDMDIEVIAKNYKFSSGKFDNISVETLEKILKKGKNFFE